MRMDISEPERQLLQIIRESAKRDHFRVHIERRDGAWEVNLTVARHQARGIGDSFADSWDSMAPATLSTF
jgi:hypothetical protein